MKLFELASDSALRAYRTRLVPPNALPTALLMGGVPVRVQPPAIELCLEVEGALDQDLEFVGIQRVTIAA